MTPHTDDSMETLGLAAVFIALGLCLAGGTWGVRIVIESVPAATSTAGSPAGESVPAPALSPAGSLAEAR